ncbi:MAG: N-acetyl-gamma-glutamyl-phosphate reductase [Candidatus Omnitrophica bacterium]|nr:N-acetyl-gamma-glutamyl-phosphate reductase [Candidatus Omnitrophota bacterium]
MSKQAKVAILGATGFTGEKLVEILLSHPGTEVTYLSSRTEVPVPYSKLFPRFLNKTDLKCETLDIEKCCKAADIIFLSLPHTVSMDFVPKLLAEKKKVIDLSADYRFKDTALYQKYYKLAHKDSKNLPKAVYGLPELFKKDIAKSSLIANPGCYPTSIILALFPLVKEGLVEKKIIIDSKSAITGAGRKAVIEYHYSNISNNLWAYKPFVHQHIPEVSEVLKLSTGTVIAPQFTPHVIGVEAGIYSTIYVTFTKSVTEEKISGIYSKYYKDCPFVRALPGLPRLKDVVGTNFCDIGFALDEKKENAVIASSIDNLVKGAAGQAVQNMNIILGLDETEGLL